MVVLPWIAYTARVISATCSFQWRSDFTEGQMIKGTKQLTWNRSRKRGMLGQPGARSVGRQCVNYPEPCEAPPAGKLLLYCCSWTHGDTEPTSCNHGGFVQDNALGCWKSCNAFLHRKIHHDFSDDTIWKVRQLRFNLHKRETFQTTELSQTSMASSNGFNGSRCSREGRQPVCRNVVKDSDLEQYFNRQRYYKNFLWHGISNKF